MRHAPCTIAPPQGERWNVSSMCICAWLVTIGWKHWKRKITDSWKNLSRVSFFISLSLSLSLSVVRLSLCIISNYCWKSWLYHIKIVCSERGHTFGTLCTSLRQCTHVYWHTGTILWCLCLFLCLFFVLKTWLLVFVYSNFLTDKIWWLLWIVLICVAYDRFVVRGSCECECYCS
jgi:hypothetical protein